MSRFHMSDRKSVRDSGTCLGGFLGMFLGAMLGFAACMKFVVGKVNRNDGTVHPNQALLPFLGVMAAGCIGLAFRVIKARRFRRVLFLVDRTALGDQTANAFKDVKLENLQSFTEIYDVKELGDIARAPDTLLHIATVQGHGQASRPSQESRPTRPPPRPGP